MTTQGRRSGPKPAGEERAAAALTGSGPSQLGVDASMRGRDVSRPRPEHDIEAEQLVQISYRPRTQSRPPLPGVRPAKSDQAPGSAGGSPEAS